MEEFKKRLLRRQLILLVGMLFACAAMIFSIRFEKETAAPQFLQGFISGFQSGAAACLLGVMVVFAVKYFVAISSPERLRKRYIYENDERRMLIAQKTGGIALNVITYGLVCGSCVAGNLNDTVFLTLLGASLFVTLIRGFLKLYYQKKL